MPLLYRRSHQARLLRSREIALLQTELKRLGHAPNGIDGIYGGQTQTAVKSWQRANDIVANEIDGSISESAWRTITAAPVPALFRRCLAITAAFEGHGYTLALGNFDKAWLTWGIIGFTLKHGSLVDVLSLVEQRIPELIDQAFEHRADEIRAILIHGSQTQRETWADQHTLNHRSGRLVGDIKDGFELLGGFPAVQEIQIEVAHDKYWSIAKRDFRRYALSDERGAQLMFDTAVQNGGISSSKRKQFVADKLDSEPNANYQRRLELIANGIAEASTAKYVEDVRSRKVGIVLGEALVHGAQYQIDDWGIREGIEVSVDDLDRVF